MFGLGQEMKLNLRRKLIGAGFGVVIFIMVAACTPSTATPVQTSSSTTAPHTSVVISDASVILIDANFELAGIQTAIHSYIADNPPGSINALQDGDTTDNIDMSPYLNTMYLKAEYTFNANGGITAATAYGWPDTVKFDSSVGKWVMAP